MNKYTKYIIIILIVMIIIITIGISILFLNIINQSKGMDNKRNYS